MSDMYVECLVKAKGLVWGKFLKILLILLAVLFFLASPVFMPYAFLLAIASGVGAYFMSYLTDVEYEYLYLDKELVVDKIMAKSKRKRIDTFSLDKVEILAPIKSYHLDNYRNRTGNGKTKDYSVGEELQPDRRFVMFYEGGQRVLLNPSEEMIKIMKNAAPRKVFAD